VTVRVPAKINLSLAVGPLREDGFHELTTVFHAISLYDEITVTPAAALRVRVEGASADEVPTDETNLAHRAVVALGARTGRDTALDVLIRKGIPVAGGCAGGSADAAAALVACDALWGAGLSREELAEVAADLGSDVPFCLCGGTALGRGRGELLSPVLTGGRFWWVLALADRGLSTPAVYAELDRQREGGTPPVKGDPADVLAALRTGSAAALGAALANDLQVAAVALRPELEGLLERGSGLGALGAVVSGSGPTVAFLLPDEAAATDLAAALGAAPGCRAALVAEGPVAGARMVGT
jgi:4-diphosphocytidyl-2-C-methyl-D-erythritol kinase